MHELLEYELGIDYECRPTQALAVGVGPGFVRDQSGLVQGTRDTTTYHRLKTALDAIPAIDTRDGDNDETVGACPVFFAGSMIFLRFVSIGNGASRGKSFSP